VKKKYYCPTVECPACGKESQTRIQDDSFDYAGTHCTGGLPGTHHYPLYYVTECCDEPLEIELIEDYGDY